MSEVEALLAMLPEYAAYVCGHPDTLLCRFYGCYALMVWLGTRLRETRNPLAIAGAGLAGEVVFFIITNFANWVEQTDYYPHTFAGLATCYAAALPFFRHSLIGLALYGSLLFGGYALIERKFAAARSAPAVAPNPNQPSAA